MKQISPYYSLYLKACSQMSVKTKESLEQAASILKEALSYKKTNDAYKSLAKVYVLLNNDEEYEKTLLEAANNGFTDFYSSLGIFYTNSDKYDELESIKWFQKGLEVKNPSAFYELARIFFIGSKAIKADFDKGMKLIEDGLALNNPNWNGKFSWLLGLSFYEKKQYDLALKYYKQALELGYKEASVALACMYRDGVGVEKDSEKYIDYLLSDLSDGNLMELATVFLAGIDSPVDYDTAIYLLRRPANRGNPRGACVLAAALCESSPDYNRDEVDYYLEVAFRNGATDYVFRNSYEGFMSSFDERTIKKIKELEKKYFYNNVEA